MKRIYLFILILVSLNVGAQTLPSYFAPIASPYDYQWLRARYLRLPTDTLSSADVGAIAFKNGALYVKSDAWTALGSGGGGSYFAGYGLNLSSGTFRVDTSLLATKTLVQGMPAYGITGTNITNWNTAYGWGNHSTVGYATQAGLNDTAAILRGMIGTGGGSSYTFSAPLQNTSGTVSITQANGSTNGYLSAVDWTLFNEKVSQDALDDTAATLRALIAAATPDSFTYATRRYVDSSVSALSGDFINNSTTQQTANFNITGNGVMGGNLDVTGSGNFAQNRVQHYHATLGGATKWYNTSGDLYSEVNPDQGGYMSSRRFVFNSAVGDPTAGTDYKGYLYMKAGAPWWSYNGTHTAIPLGGGGASTTSDLTDVSDAAPANNTVLTYNQDSGKYVPTAVAAYKFNNLQDGDYLQYNADSSAFVNVDAPTGGGGSTDSIRVLLAPPTTGNIYIDSITNRMKYRVGDFWYTVAVQDSVAVVTGGGGGYVTWGYKTANMTESGNGLAKTTGNGWDAFARTNETFVVGDVVEWTLPALIDARVGFSNTASPSSNVDFTQGVNIDSGGALYWLENGTNGSTGVTYAAGNRLRINWVNSTTVKLQKSIDGSSWSDVYTYTSLPTGSPYLMVTIYTGSGTITNIEKQ